jgi:putative DNA-invertase from lambdoid prophage Rac
VNSVPRRSVTELMATLQELEHLGVGFVSVTEAPDLTTPAGRAMAALLAVFAEFEGSFSGSGCVPAWLMPERTASGWGRLETAARHAAEIRKLHQAGISKSEIGRRLHVGAAATPPKQCRGKKVSQGIFF